MKIERIPLKATLQPGPAVYAIGNFDGVHLGHQAIIRAALEQAQARCSLSGVITFEPHPRQVLSKVITRRLTPFPEKQRLIQSLGVDILAVIPFTSSFANTSAEEFVEKFLLNTLEAHILVVGEDFAFGAGRQGNAVTLKKLSNHHGVETIIVPAHYNHSGLRYASRHIIHALTHYDLAEANDCLGRPYRISGLVMRGDGRGRLLGFPTANVDAEAYVYPSRGVYAVTCSLDNEQWPAVANLGIRPTFGGETEVLEVHILNKDIDLYDQVLTVDFHAFLREEQKFSSLQKLKEHIAQDCSRASMYFS